MAKVIILSVKVDEDLYNSFEEACRRLGLYKRSDCIRTALGLLAKVVQGGEYVDTSSRIVVKVERVEIKGES